MQRSDLGENIVVRIVAVLLLLALVVCGCRKYKEETSESQGRNTTAKTAKERYVEAKTPEEKEEARKEYVAFLAKRYAGTITAGKLETAASYEQVDKLRKEWNPVGFSPDDVKKILGQPSRETSNTLEYFFPIGSGGVGYIFTFRDDVITGVEVPDVE